MYTDEIHDLTMAIKDTRKFSYTLRHLPTIGHQPYFQHFCQTTLDFIAAAETALKAAYVRSYKSDPASWELGPWERNTHTVFRRRDSFRIIVSRPPHGHGQETFFWGIDELWNTTEQWVGYAATQEEAMAAADAKWECVLKELSEGDLA